MTRHIFNPSPSYQAIVLCQGYKGTKFQGDTTFTSQVTGSQVHATEKAIRPPFHRLGH